jgi:AcrR family transcriptional regulator
VRPLELAAAAVDDRPRGRPRSAVADRAIIDAVLEELIESGIDGLSLEQVAQRAGVAKATIYRRWPNKEALVLDALVTVEEPLPELPGTSTRDDLVALVDGIRRRHKYNVATRLYPCMISDGGRYPEIAAMYKKVVVERRREMVRDAVRRGIANGELRDDLDVETLALMMVAPMLVQTVMWYPGVEQPEELAATYVDALLDGLRATPAGRRPIEAPATDS